MAAQPTPSPAGASIKPVSRRTILVQDWVPDENGTHPVVASLVVQVPAGDEVEVEIFLPEGFDPDATPYRRAH